MEEELWMHRIRKLAEPIQKAEYEVFEADANVKRIIARLKLEATHKGCTTVSAQEVYAENTDQLHGARLNIGLKKGQLAGLKVQLDAIKVGFEEWRTKMVNMREERRNYGA